ncbi:hypothetical protein TWF192_003320 [Orbilia oligospora]|uniref:Uncharacterized protein n=1 Tax=Orbilia oligospora TaxID=2813651 RepID=A0A6G1MD63_ORBOL|nr:hypothetical protein TWF191_002821 [Orbilia oligospora]KAF3254559.1 hypothetical protein TWF192_003320 [Orbilia oligospora]
MASDSGSNFGEKEYKKPRDKLEQIREWLEPTAYEDPGSDYKRHSASHLPGTGEWLFRSDVYKNWHSSGDDGLLWIRGIPGSGKSVFAANLINRLKKEGHPVLFFFFRQIIDANHSAGAALRDWLAQICVLTPKLQEKLMDYIEESQNLSTVSIAELWNLLRDALSHLPKSYIVVDALDEMDQNQGLEPFLQALSELGEWRPSKIKIIMTSRPIARIEKCLRNAKILDIRLEESAVDVDIVTYVRHRLKNSKIPKDAQAKIEAAVPGKANGLFLFAKLALDAVLQPNANVDAVIQQLAKDLNNIYTDLLKDHSRRSGIPSSTQLLILQSVTHATRPLRLLEIADMVNFINNKEHGEEKSDLKAMKDLVRTACGPLLEILPDETVSVIHHSFTEFLNGSTRQSDASSFPILESGHTHNRLALVCLSHLQTCVGDPENKPVFKSYSKNKLHLLPPFTQYAARNWHVHVKKAALAGYDQTEAHTALDEYLTGEKIPTWTKLSDIETKNPLYAAVQLRLNDYIKYLLGKKDADTLDENPFRSPLNHAAMKGYDDIVEMFLQAGVEADDREDYEQPPLMLATRNNQLKIVKLLTNAGADPFIKVRYMTFEGGGRWTYSESHHESAFEYAARSSQIEAMVMFVPHIKTSDQANAALFQALSAGIVPIVEALLEHPMVDVDSKTDGKTPLFIACLTRRADIIKLLIKAKADPNIISDSTPWLPNKKCPQESRYLNPRKDPVLSGLATALYTLARPAFCCHSCSGRYKRSPEYSEIENITKCYEALLAGGANVNQKNENGNTVLHKVEKASIAGLLLAAGADPNAANDEHQTPLHLCNSAKVVDVLIKDPKVQIEKRDHLGRTPLLHGLVRKDAEVVIRLLELGADATAVDENGDGAFHHSIHIVTNYWNKNPHGKLLNKRLHKFGASVRLQNNQGRTALHTLVDEYSGTPTEIFVDALDYLLSIGADTEARDNKGQTPLVYFIKSAKQESGDDKYRLNKLDKLLSAGARIDTLDLRGRTVYHACLRNISSWNDPSNAFDLSRSKIPFKKADSQKEYLQKTDAEGNTLLHEACAIVRSENLIRKKWIDTPADMIRYLKEQGINISQANNMGQTPLHMLCMFQTRIYKTGKPGGGMETGEQSALDYLLEQRVDVDHSDENGITALHLASTCCELTTTHLLAAGAKVSKATHEGLTPLHIAARCRQPNILGMLLESLKTEVDPERFLTILNSKDKSPSEATALYYACASGHPVTVKLLLEAGASVDTEHHNGSPWIACARFEEEDENWQQFPTAEKQCADDDSIPKDVYGHPRMDISDEFTPDACGFLINDRTRPKVFENSGFPMRLDEILDILAQYGPSSIKYIDEAISSAASNNFDYTVECLVAKRKAVGIENPFEPDAQVELCLQRREAERVAIKKDRSSEMSSKDLETEFDLLMSLRQYEGIIKILDPAIFSDQDMDESKSSIIHELITGGFVFILKNFLTASVLSKVDEWEKHKQENKESEASLVTRNPVLLEAIKGPIPAMEIIKFLVEELGVDVNTRLMKYLSPKNNYRYEYVPTKSALHFIMTESHWWQYNLALPYLIQHGANTELRDRKGLSPLHAAVNKLELNYISTRHAIRRLVHHGANMNVSDRRGDDCLSESRCDMNIFNFFIESGAKISPSVLCSAIKDENYELLNILLSSGADPNVRLSPDERANDDGSSSDYEGTYPLECAARGTWYSRDEVVIAKMVKLLLDHGADPCAKYPDTTILHNLVGSSDYFETLIKNPSVNLEERNSNGETLLMLACRSYGSGAAVTVKLLLERGADFKAQSNDGRSALHHAIELNNGRDADPGVLRLLVSKAPEMINATDKKNRTPLVYAINHKERWQGDNADEMVNILLSAGANPNLAFNTGETALHLLCSTDWFIGKTGIFSSEKRKFFEKMVAMGADVNARDNSGETPLFKFFRKGDVRQIVPPDPTRGDYMAPDRYQDAMRATINELPVLTMFDKAKMDWKAINNAGETLMHIVASDPKLSWWPGRAVKRFKFLLDKGVDETVEDEQNRTALDVAATQDATDILDLFTRDSRVRKEEEVVLWFTRFRRYMGSLFNLIWILGVIKG